MRQDDATHTNEDTTDACIFVQLLSLSACSVIVFFILLNEKGLDQTQSFIMIALSSIMICVVIMMFSYTIGRLSRVDAQQNNTPQIQVNIVTHTNTNQSDSDLEYQRQLNMSFQETYETCIICMENVQSTRLNCGHAAFCHSCAQRLKDTTHVCPLCSAEIRVIQEEYLTRREWVPSTKSSSIEEDSSSELSSSIEEQEYTAIIHEGPLDVETPTAATSLSEEMGTETEI